MQTFAAANANQWVTDISFELLKRFRVTRETPILPLQGAGV